MDWLKDKKNQPIVATIAGVIILVVIVFGYLNMTGGSGSAPADQAAAPVADPGMGAGMPPGAPGAPGAPMPGAPAPAAAPAPGATPGAAPTATTAANPGAKQASSTMAPMESWRSDPFFPVGYKAPKKNLPKPTPPIRDFPFIRFPMPVLKDKVSLIPEPVQPARRMAGLLINDRVFAIIESNGKTEIVQPGDTLSDRLATVQTIEKDRVVLKTTSKPFRYIVVRMAASPKQTTPSPGASPGPGMPGMPGMPGGPGMPRGPRMPYGPGPM